MPEYFLKNKARPAFSAEINLSVNPDSAKGSRYAKAAAGGVPLVAAAVALSFLCAAQVFARPEMAKTGAAERFAIMDTNKDGKLSKEEFFAAQPQMKEAAFDAIDTDHDGAITREEWEAFVSGHGKDAHPDGAMPGMGGADAVGENAEQGAPAKAPKLIMPPAGMPKRDAGNY